MIINPLTGKVEQENVDLTSVRSPSEQPLEGIRPAQMPTMTAEDFGMVSPPAGQATSPLIESLKDAYPTTRMPMAKMPTQFPGSFGIKIPENTLAAKNFNPGNLRYVGQEGASEGEGGFAKFNSPEAGYAALGRQISLDAGRGHTVSSFINKFAPAVENDTAGYIAYLQKETGIDPNSKVSDVDQDKLARAMAKFESGTEVNGQGDAQQAESGPMIIDPMSGEVASGREPVTQMNPLAAGPPEKGTPEYNYLYGALDVAQGTVELARDVTWGALSWPVAQIVRHGAVAGQKIQQALGIVPSMTPEQQAAMGENIANYIQTMGGLATPKSASGKQSLEAVGKVIEPIQKIAHWTAQGINPEKYPNLHNAIATGVEFGLFATVPKVKAGLTKIKKMRENSLELKGKEKAAADLKILEEQDALMKKMNDDLESQSMNEMKALVKERQEKNQKLMAGAEGFSAIDIAKPEVIPPKVIDPITGKEVFSLKGSKSELSQSGKGFEGDVRKPNLGPEPVSGTPKLATIPPGRKSTVVNLTDESIPRTEYQINPETGKAEVTFEAGERKTYKIGESGVKLVESVPGEKSVWKVILDPMKNEKGSVSIEELSKVFGKAPKAASMLNQLIKKGISKQDLILSGLGSHLAELNQKKVDWKEFKKIADEGGFDVKKEVKIDNAKELKELIFEADRKREAFRNNPSNNYALNFIKNNKPDVAIKLVGQDVFNKMLESIELDKKIDLLRKNTNNTKYEPENNPSYNLPGHKEGSYKENLYKYDPSSSEINAIRVEIEQGKVSPALGKQAIKNITEQKKSYSEPHYGQDVMAHSRVHDRVVQIPTKELIPRTDRTSIKDIRSFQKFLEKEKENRRDVENSKIDKDVVYVDELQSNWHMQGGKEGYGQPKEVNSDYFKIKEFAKANNINFRTSPGEHLPAKEYAQLLSTAVKLKDDLAQQRILVYKDSPMIITDKVPDAPFKKTWPQMIMRDVISDAIARNKDGIAWSTGKIQAERWGDKAQTKRDAIYDKTVVNFFKNELGVDPVKVKTKTGEEFKITKDISTSLQEVRDKIVPTFEEVWYVPITGKMRRMFGDGKVMDAIDNIFMPLRNERGSIRIPTRRKQVETKISESQRNQIRKFGMMAEKAGKSFKEFLSDTGLTPKEIHAMEKLHKFVKEENPIASKLEPVKRSAGDMTPFELKPGERQVNITKGKGNKKIMIGESDATAIFESPPGRKGLFSWFKPAEFMFDKYPKLRNLLDQAREVQSTIKNELEISSKHVDALQKEFSNKKLREELGAYWHSFSILGKDAMKQMGVEVNANPKYKELKTQLEPKFKDLFDRINIQRKKLGKRPIQETGDYLSFFAKESLWTDFKDLVKGEEAKGGYSNLVLDDLATIKQRQAGAVKDSVAFHHLKRTGLRKGVKLELDPLVIYSKYLNDSLRHIHMSPINAFIKELLTAELTDFKTGKTAVFAEQRPNVAAELASWNNKIAGLDNMEVPRVFQKLLNRGMNNLTVAQLFGNLRTSFIQSTALFPTAVKHGYGATAKGIAEAAIGRKNVPIEKSSALNTATWDAAVADMGNAIAGTKYQKGKLKVIEGTAWLMKSIDYFAREATFRTVYNSLDPLVKKGKMTERDAIRLADAEVIRTQGSGDAVELAPIQRNVIGKMATQWQTFTINHMNFVAKDVLGIKNPELKPAETAKRVLRYVAGGLAINALFEQGLGIQSPMPAPVQGIIRGLEAGDSSAAIMLATMMEMAEAFPGGGSIKFGSNPLGPLVKQADDIVKALSGTTAFNKDMITKASMGDERAMIALADILGKTLGVPGTAQATKFARGQRRGESVPRSLIGRIYTEPKKKSESSSRRKRRKRRTR